MTFDIDKLEELAMAAPSGICVTDGIYPVPRKTDEFYQAAREAVPALIAEHRAKDAEIERWKGRAEHINNSLQKAGDKVSGLLARAERAEAAVAEMRERCASKLDQMAEEERQKTASAFTIPAFEACTKMEAFEDGAAAIRALPLPNETAEGGDATCQVEAKPNPPPQSQDQACGGDKSDALPEFKPCVAHFEAAGISEFIQEDVVTIWKWFGEGIQAGYSTDGRLVGVQWPLVRRASQPSDAVAAVERDVIHIVFDGPPGPEAIRFVEVETPDGKGIRVGQWCERTNGWWDLVIPVNGLAALRRIADEGAKEPERFDAGAGHDISDAMDIGIQTGLLQAGNVARDALHTLPSAPEPDTREAVKVLVEALEPVAKMHSLGAQARAALSHPAVLAAIGKEQI